MFLESFYVMVYIMGANAIAVWSIYQLYMGGIGFEVPFIYLVGTGNKVARQLKLLAQNGLPFGMQLLGYDSDTVMPTVVITDAEGKIIFADLTDNYRVRPEPETFMRVLT